MLDVRTTTGSNLKEIALLLNKRVEDLSPSDANAIEYHPIRIEDRYRVDLTWELLNVKHGNLEVDGFSEDELEMILHHICTS